MKKGKKFLSVFLAFVMVLSSFGAVFTAYAEDAYKPVYSDKVTEEDMELLLGDINTILSRDVLTGDAIESIWKALPSLKALLMHNGSHDDSGKVVFYTGEAASENVRTKFADLGNYSEDGSIVADTVDEEGNVTAEGTFTKFFNDNPIVCNSIEDFQNELNIVVDAALVNNFLQTIAIVPLFTGTATQAALLSEGLDEICKALGIEQSVTAHAALGFEGMAANRDGAVGYIKNIIAAVMPDTSNQVVKMIQRIAVDENGALLYSGINKVVENLAAVVAGVNTMFGSLVDLTSFQTTMDNLKATIASLPTVGDGETKRFDIEGLVSYLVSSLTDDALTIQFVDRAENDAKSSIAIVAIKFRHMKLDRLANAASTADAVKIVYDYLYDNLIADSTNNGLISMAITAGIIEGALGVEIPQEVEDFILAALEMENTELANELVVMVADAAGRDIPVDPVPPVTDPEDPTDPSKDDPKDNPKDDPKDDPDVNTGNKPASNNSVKNPNLPDTGSQASDSTAIFAVLAVASAVGMAVILVSRKKVSE